SRFRRWTRCGTAMRSTRSWTRWAARQSRRTAPASSESCRRVANPSAGCRWPVSSSAIGRGSTPFRRSSISCSPLACSRPRERRTLSTNGIDTAVKYKAGFGASRRPLGPFSVAPIGYGAMRLAGPNVFGPPKDRRQAIAVLREAVDRGVNHIDTAQFYGPDVVNELIRDALRPYPPQLVIVSKVGASRDKRGGIFAADAPGELRRGIEDNLRTLDLDTLGVVNLRLMRPSGPDAYFDDQLAAMVSARDDGLIATIRMRNITLAHPPHA